MLDGVAGDDTFQFGQVFGTDPTAATAVAPGDEIATVDTTVGWLSRGVSYATTAYAGAIPATGAFYQLNQADGSGDAAGLYQWNGAAWVPSTSTAPGGTPSGTALPGRGDATFTVYSNKATLKLFGEGGNNTFIVRAFLIISTGQSATSQTDITTGNGNNQIEYNINAPVAIDGGSGFNTLLIIGTDANDTFVITKDGIMGAGLNVSYTNIEKIEVDGEGGNDTFDVLSTDPDAVTVLEGGSGSNTFNVSGDVTTPVVALNADGTSGVINHSVSSADPDYNGIFAAGVPVSVAGTTAGQVIIGQSAGGNTVEQTAACSTTPLPASCETSYTISLGATRPTDGTIWYVTVAAAARAGCRQPGDFAPGLPRRRHVGLGDGPDVRLQQRVELGRHPHRVRSSHRRLGAAPATRRWRSCTRCAPPRRPRRGHAPRSPAASPASMTWSSPTSRST